MTQTNPMRSLRIAKVVVNIGVGESGEKLLRAEKLLEKLTGQKPVRTIAKKKIPVWGVKRGEPIGCKVTLRKKKAEEFLRRAFEAVDNRISAKSFDNDGNLSFGVHEYIDFPDMKFDPEIGMFGMDISVEIERPGYRIKRRRLQKRKIPTRHKVRREEAMEFIKEKFEVDILS
ncbi:MAG TPA: 50S ribosomal protein L5 [Candidatus Altiarchaeales archaeon]|nr:50S ribosomal protein L5 [Candidatus Altiarchaeales archaeon]